MTRVYGLTIQGIGTTDGLYRFAAGPIANDTDNLYLSVLGQLPKALAEVDLMKQEVSIGGTQAILRNEGLPTSLRAWQKPSPIALVVAESGTTVDLDTPALDGSLVHWRQEAIILGSGAAIGGGVYRYTGCTRGALQTRERSVLSQYANFRVSGYDNEVFDRPPDLRGRKVTFFYNDGDFYGNETTLFNFCLDDLGNVEGNDHIILRLKGGLYIADKARALARHAEYTVENIAGTLLGEDAYDIDEVRAYSIRPEGSVDYYNPPASLYSPSTGDKLLVEFRGSVFEATVAHIFASNRHVITFDPRTPYRGMTSPQPLSTRTEALGETVREVIAAGYRARSFDEPPTLGTDIVDTVMSLLTSTPEGDNGDFDKGMDVGPGMDSAWFDLQVVRATRSSYAGILRPDRYLLGAADYSASALTEIRKLLSGSGVKLTYGPTGLVVLRPWVDRPRDITLNKAETFLSQSFKLNEVVDTVTVEYSPSGLFLDDIRMIRPIDLYLRQRMPGLTHKLDFRVEAIGDSRTVFALAMGWYLRAIDARPMVTAKVSMDENVYPLQPVFVDLPGGYSSDGSDGISAYGVVVSVELDPERDIKIVRVRIGDEEPKVIGHGLKVDTAAYTGTAVVPVELNHFVQVNSDTEVDYDADLFAVNDVVNVVDSDGAVSDTGLTILVNNVTDVTLDRTPTTPAGQWYLVSANYTGASTNQQETFTYQDRSKWAH